MPEMLDRDLEALHHQFVAMGQSVSTQIKMDTTAFKAADATLAQRVIDADPGINDDELALEKLIIQTLALQQPMATDFRRVMSILQSATDLERIGDHAVGIAREAKDMDATARVAAIDALLTQMTDAALDMLHRILEAYVAGDQAQAREIAAKDLEVDRLFLAVRTKATAAANVQVSASYLFVARLLERIGDHVVNIAEWIVFDQTGKLVELNIGKTDRRRVTADDPRAKKA